MTPLADGLRDAAARIAGVSDTPRLDAELLAAHALGLERADMLLRMRDLVVPDGLAGLIERRLTHEPVAQIVGTRDFWTITLCVSRDVLTPRPDTETLLDAAVEHFRGRAPTRILDLGTGSGALLLAALDEWRDASGLGVDISAAALDVARGNAARLGMSARAMFVQGDWADGVEERFDLVLANPPYIATGAMLPREVSAHEPHLALFAGADGLDAYRVLARAMPRLIAPGGMAAVEIGFDQGESAAALFAEAGLNVTLRRDLAGRARCLVLEG